jgi:hypothetical protein
VDFYEVDACSIFECGARNSPIRIDWRTLKYTRLLLSVSAQQKGCRASYKDGSNAVRSNDGNDDPDSSLMIAMRRQTEVQTKYA